MIASKISVQRAEFSLSQQSNATLEPSNGATVTLKALGIRHGDMIYVNYDQRLKTELAATQEVTKPVSSSGPNHVLQDAVDDILEKQSGLVQRKRDSTFCKHGDKGMCEYCSPLEPYDLQYLETQKIKHMSFHAYIRQLTVQNRTSQTGSGFVHPLEEPFFKVRQPCSSAHAPWPNGICSKCQPSAISLQRQTFRMVDHVEFETPAMIEEFLRFWRTTGFQRFGWLYGRYEAYSEVPLGVKAVVSVIYEPPQNNAVDGMELMHVEGTVLNHQQTLQAQKEHEMVHEMATLCGLTEVGMIFSDLVDDGSGKGKVVCKRHANAFFISSLEVIFAAHMQRQWPTKTKLSASGMFGSRFVTCVASGNKEGGIEIEAYQVSNTATSMVDAALIDASIDPAVVRVKEPTQTLYVPDVIYKYKNEYNATVQQNAKATFPVDYLLVNVSHGFPSYPSSIFHPDIVYPIENRPTLEPQDLVTMHKQLNKTPLVSNLSNFHLLLHIRKLNIFSLEEFEKICQIATGKSKSDPNNTLQSMPGFQTLMAMLKESDTPKNNQRSTQNSGSSGSSVNSTSAPWACRHCTFLNQSSAPDCEMCGLPRE